MVEETLRQLLDCVQKGTTSIDEAISELRTLPFEDLGFAKIDHHRSIRCGFPEAILCEGKTTEQVRAIFDRCVKAGSNVLATRATQACCDAVLADHPQAEYSPAGRTITLRQNEKKPSAGTIVIVTAGTSDLPVAEEARITAELMDQTTTSIIDVGVAGMHRLLAHADPLQSANVAIVVAGMEGALASVVGGLVDCPVIAVPTSIGYGASFGGIAALLGMLNTCAAGVTVVNIDNGFGAAHVAALINRRCKKQD